MRSDRALVAGDYLVAWDESLAAAEDDNLAPYNLSCAVRAALWANDLERARTAADRLDGDPASDPGAAADRIAARAGIAALEGCIDDAVAGYRDALVRQRAIDADLSAALTGLDFVLLVGAGHPAARDAAAEARAILERVNARFYLGQLKRAMRPAVGADHRGAVDRVATNTGA